jgi:hypothetical protein
MNGNLIDAENGYSMESYDRNRTSIAKILLVFYVLIGSSYADVLISKQLKECLQTNRLVQHLIGFITMVVLVSLVGGVVDTKQIIFYSVISYLLFILSTKADIHWNLIILTTLFIGYMYENQINQSERLMEIDQNIPRQTVALHIAQNEQQRTYIVIFVILLICIGTLFYARKKEGQYGGGYDIFKYLLY